ncbi:MAG: class I SAM-dependent methyltransferase [Chloroflexota bacterium]|nr:class I SAM-dependent methyltransferase [Chloroflexota bacterium]
MGARDFRAALYERYVSTFKGDGSPGTEPSFAWWDHKYLPLLSDLDTAAPMLEIGCGDGGLLAYLGRRGFSNAAGLDISPEQVQVAKARGVRAEVGDVFESLAGRAGTLAAIIGVDVFEHFSRDELMRLAPLLHAALQPGGRLLVQTANGAGLFPGQVIYGDLTHMTIFTPQSLDQLLRASGFVDLAFYETGPIPIRLRGKVDVAVWGAIKRLASAVRYIETGKRQVVWTENFICLARKAETRS